MTICTPLIRPCGKVLTSTAPVMVEPTERWPFSRTRVRVAPRPRRFRALTPEVPALIEALEVCGVALPTTDGMSLTKSATLEGAAARISVSLITVSGVGA